MNTVRNRLRQYGLNARRPYVGSVLTRRHRQERLRWGRAHQRFTRRQWSKVLFSDETRIQLHRADGRKRVWRRVGERYRDNCVIERNTWGGGSIHIWAGITRDHKTPLVIFNNNVTAHTYVNNVVQPVIVPFMQQNFPNGDGILQQDNAPPHTARMTRQHLQQNNVNVLPWPALSPDMSPIEHVWSELKTRIERRRNPPQTLRDLRAAAIQEWQNFPQVQIRRKIDSMFQRCRALVAANGGHTRFWHVWISLVMVAIKDQHFLLKFLSDLSVILKSVRKHNVL